MKKDNCYQVFLANFLKDLIKGFSFSRMNYLTTIRLSHSRLNLDITAKTISGLSSKHLALKLGQPVKFKILVSAVSLWLEHGFAGPQWVGLVFQALSGVLTSRAVRRSCLGQF